MLRSFLYWLLNWSNTVLTNSITKPDHWNQNYSHYNLFVYTAASITEFFWIQQGIIPKSLLMNCLYIILVHIKLYCLICPFILNSERPYKNVFWNQPKNLSDTFSHTKVEMNRYQKLWLLSPWTLRRHTLFCDDQLSLIMLWQWWNYFSTIKLW